MTKQIVRREVGDTTALNTLHPLLQRIFSARQIQSLDELDRELSGLHSFQTLKNIDQAVARLIQALKQQERILIVGDYDADGATSTALAVSALQDLGFAEVDYIVPNRFTYGYGLTPEIVDLALAKHPDLIITVDNGIASHRGVDRANECGIAVIITDHHLPGEGVPKAAAIVNPNQPGDLFPSKCMAGVGVIFYVMLALRAALKKQGWFAERSCPNMAQYLDLVALGTVADVVKLDRNNRILVYQGLQRIRRGKVRPGIAALITVSERSQERLRATDLGFAVGPRLNAAGRLDDMSLGIACLLAEDEVTAQRQAERLDSLNRERRTIEAQMQLEAFAAVTKLDLTRKLPLGLCLYDEHWHQGVIGLVASRVKEKVNRPVIAFAKDDDHHIKGSARSIKGVNIRDVLDAIATAQPQLIKKFGGHAMAAGLTVPLEYYEAFSECFANELAKVLTETDLYGRLDSDGELKTEELVLPMAEMIRNAGPWGQGFPEPLFDGVFQLIDQRIVGERHLKVVLQANDGEYYLDGIAFNVDLQLWPNYHCCQVHVAYRLDVNEYRGHQKLQLLIEHIELGSLS